eukprot:TRINITY_DN2132_c0_g3_i1.p2 TRINITY_DN2132_c0_g3~~TRINITY_DN2132_c0_g3_i1.p2  ORF type:complete len:141 (-),score=50.40 TRINITY_DN2132_c0_g3_i1:77-499(-)
MRRSCRSCANSRKPCMRSVIGREREKDRCEKDHEKYQRELMKVSNERTELEKLAEDLNGKKDCAAPIEQLEEVTSEKEKLELEYTHNQEVASKYSEDITKLKEEFDTMRQMITHTFEDELKSLPSIAKSERRHSKSPKVP